MKMNWWLLTNILREIHCAKSVQIRSYFWSVFSCIQTEYRKTRTRNNYVFGHSPWSDFFIILWKRKQNPFQKNLLSKGFPISFGKKWSCSINNCIKVPCYTFRFCAGFINLRSFHVFCVLESVICWW